ncbi:MAG: SDR family oxidoreductase [Pyrinomonadaceae bacterium MAG19_C2-C3]|nr:SDR family oxidoreductase [Pyrinomonadaceae bacterium MAG19_C2-C3]
MRFKDKIVWVTGASSGIGEALVYAFHREGARVILSARRADELARVRANCEDDGHLILPLDLTDFDGLPEKVEQVLECFGRVDILVHNGGVSQRALAKDTKFEVDQALININYLGAVRLTKAVLPSMLERRNGHFVVITSIVGHVGTPLRSAYAASKHALHGFFNSLRAEVWRENVKVTIVCPGYIHTEVSINALTGDGSKLNKMDGNQAHGMSAEACAARILDAVAREKEEVLVGGKEKVGVYLKRFLPSLLSKLVRVR